MRHLSGFGRMFYGSAIAIMGLLTIYYRDFPYMLIPSVHPWIRSVELVAYFFGGSLFLAGTCIGMKIKVRPISLILGAALLLIFCFYFIPYQFLVSPNYRQFGDWENAAKELSLAGGAFVVAGCVPDGKDSDISGFLSKLIPFGSILFALTIISFGIDHYLFAKEAADYIPSWVPFHLFWMYFTGTALIGAGISIVLKIKPRLFATLLAVMIFIWFVILHIPRVIDSPVAHIGSEITSAVLALAYSGIAFMIGGTSKR